ncbi:membrane carboxypeptidase/penicillin-binding protein [Flammeovirgaceae bacterium 311]|nr:membrane carboxypeptidase/penicillin-binding protein [Flammeovirgaceae bacterium 311]
MVAVKNRKRKENNTADRKQRLYRNIVIGMWSFFFGLLLLIPLYIYSVSIDLFGLYGDMPSTNMLENAEKDLSSELISSDGKLLGKYFRENRVNVTYHEISPNLVKSLTAVEDARFRSHSGIDGVGLIRVAVKSILLGQNKGGGSTLSQQTAKVLFDLRVDEQFEGRLSGLNYQLDMLIKKTKEWILAVRLESTYTKDELMAMYLNTVDFGSHSFGIKVASQTFFNKTPIDLNIQEAATLAGIVQNPSRLSPVRNPNNATHRRNVVINQMVKYGYLTQHVADSVKRLPLKLDYRREDHNEGLAPYFRSVLKGFLAKWAKENNYDIYKDGLKIYTTIDSRMQKHAEEAVAGHMAQLQAQFNKEWGSRNPWIDDEHQEIKGYIEQEAKKTEHYRKLVRKWGSNADSVWIVMKTKRPMRVFSYKGEIDTLMSPLDSIRYNKRFLHTGFMAMDPYTGAVKAWVGGINHRNFQYDHVLQGKRQPGSTFKTFVYATAIENGYSPCFSVYDIPRSYPTGNGSTMWEPKNSNGKYTNAPMSLREAMALSVNTVTADIMFKMKPDNVVNLARRAGITSEMDPVLSLALGTSDISVLEMVGAYSTFVNKGVHTQPFYIVRIEDKNGNVLYEPKPKTVEALHEETAYLMLHMLKGATELSGGSATRLSPALLQKMEIGGKTGTTQNASDGWFMGVTPELVAGAWVGGDSRNIRFPSWVSGQGGRTALPIWDRFMSKVMKDPALGFKKTTFDAPATPLSVETDCNRYNGKFPVPDNQEEADSLYQRLAPVPAPDIDGIL